MLNEENEKKKEFLRGYRKSLKREERICDDIQELRARKMFPSCAMGDGMSHGSNQTDLSNYIVILDEMLENLRKERRDGAVKRSRIETSIRALHDENEQEVLRLRYIKGMKWEEVSVEIGCSWQHTHRIHASALKNLIIM